MLAVRKQEWKKPAMRAVTDTGIILECLYDAYGMEGKLVLSGKNMYSRIMRRAGHKEGNAIEYDIKHSEITGKYRLILDKLLEKRDLETVLFLRIMMETGLRSREAYALKPEYIRNRQIDLPRRFQKNNGKDDTFALICSCYPYRSTI